MFVAGISALYCYTYDSLVIANSCRKRKKEPKDIELWIRESIKNNSNLSSELHIIRINEKKQRMEEENEINTKTTQSYKRTI